MPGRGASAALRDMTEHEMLERATERFERRLAEECGKVRVEIANGHGALRAEMAHGFGLMRTEMGDRNAQLLQWGLVYAVTLTGVIAALLALFRN